ncbi:MAG: hypothetical protein H6835_09400 [Planctomycetes bacterium]|nr:hypothetical protein [Planctomycetota bacterium]
MSDERPSSPPPRRSTRLASVYVLGLFGVALVALMLMRGAGRLLVPLLLIGAVVWVVHRVVQKIREPID